VELRRGRLMKPTRPTCQILWARACRDHTITGADSIISGLCGTFYRLPVFPRWAAGGLRVGAAGVSKTRPRKAAVRSLGRRKVVPFPSISGCESRPLKELHALVRALGASPRPIRKRRQPQWLVRNQTLGLSSRAASTRTNIEQRGLVRNSCRTSQPAMPASKLKDSYHCHRL
jgi:hypothetical protein